MLTTRTMLLRLLLLASLLTMCHSDDPTSSNRSGRDSRPKKVAIIGAGVAGLSTANRFLEKGFKNFQIFEALDRTGGRVFPVKYKDGYLQMGAQFINGDRNPLFELADKLGVVGEIVGDFQHFEDSAIRYGNCPIQDADIEAFRAFVAPLDDDYHDVAYNDEERSYSETVKSMYDRDYDAFLKAQNATTGFRRKVFDSLTGTVRSYFEFEYAAKWEDLSLRAITEWDDLDDPGNGVSYSTTKIGYAAIIQYLTAQIPKANIHYNHRIANIDFTGDKTKLILVDGTVIPDEFDYVIVTSAIGHLKKYARKMFTPSLPKRKLQAIDKIGMGTSAKVFVEFPETTWRDNFVAPLLVAGCHGRKELTPIETEFNTFQVVPWAENLMMGWIAGHGPGKIDNVSDEELSKILVRMFRDVYKNESIPEPTGIIRMKWTHNDLFGGSYSYVSYGQAQAKIRHSDMSIPVRKDGKIRIQFAGEATHHRIFQTAVGAFLSGRREADRVMHDVPTSNPSIPKTLKV